MPAARAFRPIDVTLPALLFGSSQIHMPSPRKTAGSAPPAEGRGRTTGCGRTTRRIPRDRRPARSVTRTEIVPAFTPTGTRTTHPAFVWRSLAASAPRDQRKLTRMPALKPRPRNPTCLPICTCGRARHDAFVAGTQRRPVSSGAGVRPSAPAGARPAARLAEARIVTALRYRRIRHENRVHARKSRRLRARTAGGRSPLAALELLLVALTRPRLRA